MLQPDTIGTPVPEGVVLATLVAANAPIDEDELVSVTAGVSGCILSLSIITSES